MGKLIQNISVRLGLFFFGKRKPLSYCIFNFLFSIFVTNNSINTKIITKFKTKGFTKLNENFSDEIKQASIYLKETEKTNKAQTHYKLDLNTKSKIIQIFSKKMEYVLNELDQYYNYKPAIVDATVWTNHNYKRDDIRNSDTISESFHCDGYLSNYLKIHINFQDVGENDGAMTIVEKNKSKKFLKDFEYSDRYSYKREISKEMPYIYKNVGQKGEALLFDAANCFHCANIPERNNLRTMMQIVLFIPPYKLKDSNQIEKHFNNYKNFTKPSRIIEICSLFFKYMFKKKTIARY